MAFTCYVSCIYKCKLTSSYTFKTASEAKDLSLKAKDMPYSPQGALRPRSCPLYSNYFEIHSEWTVRLSFLT